MNDARARWSTWQEILSQPAVWRGWGDRLDVAGLRQRIDALGIGEVWFCGAGSSAFVGDILAATLTGSGLRYRSVPTTDLVANPGMLTNQGPALVVNFGRSGNSSETLGTLAVLETLAPNWPRLNITCNAGSALALRSQDITVVLPEATHDAGFAMTSSFTTMLLTALALFDRSVGAADVPSVLNRLADGLDQAMPVMIAHADAARLPDRAVFLGTGPLAFAAREAALKVMELSAGRIPALWDSTLGFRHGPKSFVLDKTDIWLFRSETSPAMDYDDDLAGELARQFPASRVTVVGTGPRLPTAGWCVVLPVVLAQILGVTWSASLGLPVDDPFAGKGTLSRVVEGVRLHPVVRP